MTQPLAGDAVADREALKKIAGGCVAGASTMIVEGRWQDFATALQQIAKAALDNASPPGAPS